MILRRTADDPKLRMVLGQVFLAIGLAFSSIAILLNRISEPAPGFSWVDFSCGFFDGSSVSLLLLSIVLICRAHRQLRDGNGR